jgi:hypothetical protein
MRTVNPHSCRTRSPSGRCHRTASATCSQGDRLFPHRARGRAPDARAGRRPHRHDLDERGHDGAAGLRALRRVKALSRVMAADLADSPVTINLLLPGGATDTGMIPDDTPAEARERLLDPRSWDRQSSGSPRRRRPGSTPSGSSPPSSSNAWQRDEHPARTPAPPVRAPAAYWTRCATAARRCNECRSTRSSRCPTGASSPGSWRGSTRWGHYEDDRLPRLAAEKRLIAVAVGASLPYWGVWLGAQLLSARLGAAVGPRRPPRFCGARARSRLSGCSGMWANRRPSCVRTNRKNHTPRWHCNRSARPPA